ncbi:hypothetical protein N7523_002405 [Penicillium sp. IBT 18751x]|nr:hypothetical protein N7523_002405 [Penicillium sp. IBT 18751x]
MKVCLVTVGATASFLKLVRQVLSEPFLACLKQHDYTHLLVQYGKDGKPMMDEFLANNPEGSDSLHGIGIGGFDFKPNMDSSIHLAMADEAKNQEQGLMITHAGTGSILEGLRAQLPLIVVPNTDLADNHQEQLAIELDRTKYAVNSLVEDLVSAVAKAESMRHQRPGMNGAHESSQENEMLVSRAMADQLATLD